MISSENNIQLDRDWETIDLDNITSIPGVGEVYWIDFTTEEICVTTGDTVVINWENTDTNFDLDILQKYNQERTSLRPLLQPSCSTAPEVNEEEYETTDLITDMGDFLGSCDGELDLQVESSIYTGMGYAISQQFQGLQDYENTFFAVMKKPSLNEAQAFQVCYYFPSYPDRDWETA